LVPLGWGVGCAATAEVVGAGARLRRGTSPWAVLLGFSGVLVAVAVVLYTGRAAALSLAGRWPLLGVIVGVVLGRRAAWRRDPALYAPTASPGSPSSSCSASPCSFHSGSAATSSRSAPTGPVARPGSPGLPWGELAQDQIEVALHGVAEVEDVANVNLQVAGMKWNR
jgi:hypothetical protein